MRNPFRAAARRMADSGGAGEYRGAGMNRFFYDYVMGVLSANRALRGSLQTLRVRARELVTRNSHASAIPRKYSENVIGSDGIGYSAAVVTGDGTLDERTNRELELKWYRWCEARHCTVDRSQSWPEVLTLLEETEITDGEALLRLVPNFDSPFGFAVDVLDVDQLDHTLERDAAPGQNAIVMGVEIDAWHAPVAYWLWSNHPSDNRGRGRIRVPASEIIHAYTRRRPRQLRAATWFAPFLVDLAMHGGWREAHVIASRAASAKMGVYELDENAEPAEPDANADGTEGSHIPTEAAPGIFEQLPKGWKLKMFDPTFPSTSFDAFDNAMLRSVGVGSGLSHMSVSGDLNQTTYGSGRIGLLSEQAVFRQRQKIHIARECEVVHGLWLRWALFKGALALPSFDAERYAAATWHPKPQPWLAPEEDLNIRLARIRSGMGSLSQFNAELGLDTEDVFRQQERDRKLAERYGLQLDFSPTTRMVAPLVGAPAQPAAPAGQAEVKPPLRLAKGELA